MKARIVVGIASVALLIATGSYLGSVLRGRSKVMQLWSQVKVDASESEVRSLLGTPECYYDAASAPTDYYVEGYGRKERSISGAVLIYRSFDLVLYVWLAARGESLLTPMI